MTCALGILYNHICIWAELCSQGESPLLLTSHSACVRVSTEHAFPADSWVCESFTGGFADSCVKTALPTAGINLKFQTVFCFFALVPIGRFTDALMRQIGMALHLVNEWVLWWSVEGTASHRGWVRSRLYGTAERDACEPGEAASPWYIES